MTNAPSAVSPTGADGFVTDELADLLLQAVVRSPDAGVRASVVSQVVQELCIAVAWLHGTSAIGQDATVDRELLSLRRVAVAAQEHLQRMRLCGTDEAGTDLS
jgi:hypothetical protein